ncbi:MAG: hypothetical protein WD009_05190 [Phycisphaeraceae bacterium]
MRVPPQPADEMLAASDWSPVTRHAAARYLALQGVAGGAWWLMLLAWPHSRRWFFPDALSDAGIRALAVADISLFVVGSFVAAFLLHRRPDWGLVATAIVAGATAYATLYCWGASVTTGEAWLATALMSAATAMTGVCVWSPGPVLI